jgi:hypothetical protein
VITERDKLLPVFEDLLEVIQNRYKIFAEANVETIE